MFLLNLGNNNEDKSQAGGSLLLGGLHHNLWKLFDKENLISKEKFKAALIQSKKKGRFLTEVIMEDESINEEKILALLSEYFKMPYVFLRNKVIALPVVNLIPKEIAEQHSVIIFKKIKNIIFVATSAPENHQIIHFIRKKTGLEPKVFVTTPRDISVGLQKYNSSIKEDFAKIIDRSIKEALSSSESPEKLAQFVPMIRMVNSIIDRALSKNASDIHIESNHEKVVVRFRIDGMLYKIVELPSSLCSPIITRIKILSDLKIDEHMLPQDGRFQYNYNNQDIAIRVSVIPTMYGPKIALRLLEMKQSQFTLSKLGLNKSHLQLLKKEINSSHGMILVTGPTGSGKTTTLYTILKILNKESVNICTIEDPIEYGIDNINQMQVKPQIGLTFAAGLRSLLRQDPNIIMIGEIRDQDTANIAVNSAMTGHLVLSTLHTNSAFLAPQRLSEMGVQTYLLSPVLNIIIGQRLVRKICKKCRTRVKNPDKIYEFYSSIINLEEIFSKLKKRGLILGSPELKDMILHKGAGCSECNHTGYKGRLGIYEVLKIDEELKKIIMHDPSEEAIKKYLMNMEEISMMEDGILKVFEGTSTFEEVLRVTKE